MTTRATLRRERDGMWSASAPSLPGCITWGATPTEAQRHLHAAAELYLESLRRRGLPMPVADGMTVAR